MIRATSISKAFTLIELLVVIAIIALLVSILMPSLKKAQELAKGVACLSNLRNVGMSVAMFQEANDGRLPASEAGNSSLWKWQLMVAAGAEPYGNSGVTSTKGYEYFFCPSWDKDGFTPPAGLEPWYSQWLSYKVAISQAAMSTKWGAVKYLASSGSDKMGLRMSDIGRSPGEVVFTCDAIGFNDSLFWNPSHVFHETIGVSDRHVDKANALWLDGHGSAEQAITDEYFEIE